jgi:hypothetical protein
MNTFSQSKVHHIRWKLFEKRKRITENMELRRKMVEDSYHMQLQNDQNSIQSHVAHLQPGTHKAFLQTRLAELNRAR